MPESASLNYEPFASNPYAQQSTRLDYDHEHAPTSKTYHGITIAVSGAVIGRIQSWDTSGAWKREGEHVYELSANTWGKPVDYVPGAWKGLTINASVAEMWGKEIDIQLSIKKRTQMNDLIEQSKPFTTHEFWYRGVDEYRIWVYRGCWLTDRDETAYSADGNARVIANFQFNYVSRQIVS